MYIKIIGCSAADKAEAFRIAQVYHVAVTDCNKNAVLLECALSEEENDDLISLLKGCFPSRIEIVRGGNVAIESISKRKTEMRR